jgi:uncharacterized LabA/DUF88 family protein
MSLIAFAFVDGAYLRQRADEAQLPWVDPHGLAQRICASGLLITAGDEERGSGSGVVLHRVTYYDALADRDEDVPEELKSFWDQVELLPDTHLGFGSVRGIMSDKPRQKGVDTLISVDMVVGAFAKLFDMAILIAGDADFVPALREVGRRGLRTVVAAVPGKGLAADLRRCADRFVPIAPSASPLFPRLVGKEPHEGRTWGRGKPK